jgi:hypothetical protein
VAYVSAITAFAGVIGEKMAVLSADYEAGMVTTQLQSSQLSRY